MVSALLPRGDASVVTVERDRRIAALAARGNWPAFVDFRVGNALDFLPQLGTFDLLFADSPDAKWRGLDKTIGSLKPGGLLIVDDMNPVTGMTAERRAMLAEVRRTLFSSPILATVDMRHGSGVILSARH
jgi:predicted O-methyltransferase YrrM